jgi:hypothetical protein
MNFQLTIGDWVLSVIIPSVVTLYVATAKNNFPKGTDDYTALRVCRIGLALLLWSFGSGLIGFAFALTSFILGIVGIVKGRTIYGIALIVGSIVLPVVSVVYTFNKVTSLFTQGAQKTLSAPGGVKSSDILNIGKQNAIPTTRYSEDEIVKLGTILNANPCYAMTPCTRGNYNVQPVDLNDDETLEFIISKVGYCGSGGCEEALVMQFEGKWKELLGTELGVIKIVEEKNNGFHNVELWESKEATEQGIAYTVRHFTWNGLAYQLSSTAKQISR